MKSFRSFVLQDLPNVLPSKGFQGQLITNCQLSSAHVHTSAASRRFWNLFEFTAKEEIGRDANKCPSSKDITSSSMMTSSDQDSATKNLPPNTTYTSTVPVGPKNYGYLLDLKSTPMSCLKVNQPLQQDNLMSLLDGNPVPKTLKWKLKGYRTLRNEQAGDFAFVPGVKSNDYDIISRNESTGPINAANNTGQVVTRNDQPKSETVDTIDRTETLCLTNKAIEHKEELLENTKKIEAAQVIALPKDIPDQEPTNNPNDSIEESKVSVVCSSQKLPTLPKLLASSIPMNEDIKFLPVSKSELSSSQLKYQTQPAAQYSSRPPKRFSKPSAPVLKQTTEKRSTPNVRKFTPPMESYQENRGTESQQTQSPPEALASRQPEAREEIEKEWSSVDAQESNRHTEQQQYQERDQNVTQLSSNPNSVEQEQPLPLSEPLDEPYKEEPTAMEPRQTVVNENRVNRRQQYDQHEPNTYFAPRSNKYPSRSSRSPSQNYYPAEDRTTYESMVGLPPRQHPILNIPHPSQNQQRVKSSPCAASHVRLQEGTGSEAASNSQAGPFDGSNSGMSSGHSAGGGGSGRGPKKPPGSLPPFTTRRSSSHSCCLLKKITIPRDVEDTPRSGLNSMNPSSNISTSSIDAARKCGDDDSNRCKNKGRSCKPQRKCEPERPKCKKEKKGGCKRYCCPELHARQECDFSQFQCPNVVCNNPPKPLKPHDDPTCMPDEEVGEGRDICTSPSRKKKPEKACKKERPCGQEKREQSCGQEERGCQKRRSCKKQEPACPQQQQDQGREICTKPRKKENSCKRERKCNDRGSNNKRSAKCSGKRHYTQSAYMRQWKSLKNVKRYSSVPAFAFPFIGMRTGTESKQRLQESIPDNRFYGKETKPPTCKDSKTENKCKKESKKDPCKAVAGSCDKKKDDPCKKASQTSCGGKKKESSCGKEKSKSEDLCAKRREQLCKDRQTSSKSSDESTKERVNRERKEMEECKKGGSEKKEKGKKEASGLERVVSPCKQKQSKDKGSKCKFAALDIPYNCFSNTMSTAAIRQDSYHKNILPNISTERSYSTTINPDFDNEQGPELDADANFWNLHDDNFNIDELNIPILDEEEIPDDHASYSSNWLLSWFNGNQY